jgi:hypothetical protein
MFSVLDAEQLLFTFKKENALVADILLPKPEDVSFNYIKSIPLNNKTRY